MLRAYISLRRVGERQVSPSRNMKNDVGLEVTPDEVLAAATACKAIYDKNPEMLGWKAVSLSDLGLPESFSPSGVFINKNAMAFLNEIEVDGEKSLIIAFKGTDKFSIRDWRDNVMNINQHFDLLKPLIEALDRYIVRTGVKKVIATGHSLGGAMACMYMNNHVYGGQGLEDVHYDCVTFGSPGARFDTPVMRSNLLAFRHAADVVPKIGQLRGMIAGVYSTPGKIIEMAKPRSNKGLSKYALGYLSHSMKDYLDTITHLHRTNCLQYFIDSETDLEVKLAEHQIGTIDDIYAEEIRIRPEWKRRELRPKRSAPDLEPSPALRM